MKILIATDCLALIISRMDACLDGIVLHGLWEVPSHQVHF